MALSMREAIGMSDTYTLSGQNVYVSCPRRIRFTLEMYTFSSQNVYVLLAIRIRSDQAGYTLRAKGLATSVLVMLVKMETRLERAGEVGGN